MAAASLLWGAVSEWAMVSQHLSHCSEAGGSDWQERGMHADPMDRREIGKGHRDWEAATRPNAKDKAAGH